MSPRPLIASRGKSFFSQTEVIVIFLSSVHRGGKNTGPSEGEMAILSFRIDVIILSRAKDTKSINDSTNVSGLEGQA